MIKQLVKILFRLRKTEQFKASELPIQNLTFPLKPSFQNPLTKISNNEGGLNFNFSTMLGEKSDLKTAKSRKMHSKSFDPDTVRECVLYYNPDTSLLCGVELLDRRGDPIIQSGLKRHTL